MTNITIPSGTSSKQDLVAVPKSIYRDFLSWQKKIKSVKTYKPTATEKKELAAARKDIIKGKFFSNEICLLLGQLEIR